MSNKRPIKLYKSIWHFSAHEAADIYHYQKNGLKPIILTRDNERAEIIKAKEGCESSLISLLQSHQRLVINISKKYTSHSATLLDLMAYGNLGLLEAIVRFDTNSAVRLMTYAKHWIRQHVAIAALCFNEFIHTPGLKREQMNAFKQKGFDLEKQLEHSPKFEEIAAHFDINIDELWKLVVSYNEASSVTFNESIVYSRNDEDTPINRVAEKELSQLLNSAVRVLRPLEKKLIRLRYGFGKHHAHTLDEIAAKVNKSKSWVAYKIANIEKQMKRTFEKNGLTEDVLFNKGA